MTSLIGAAFMPHPPIILPEIGQGSEKESAETLKGIEKIVERAAADQPQVIIVITPHGYTRGSLMTVSENTILSGDFSAFGHSEIQLAFENNQLLVEKLLYAAKTNNLSLNTAINDLDHGALVPLYFLNRRLPPFMVVHISIGWGPPSHIYENGRLLRSVFSEFDESVLLLASGDLSHRLKENGPYGFHPQGPIFDEMVKKAFENNRLPDLLSIPEKTTNAAGQCGLAPFILAAGLLDQQEVNTQLYSYEGPFGIGYLNAYTSVEKRAVRHPYVELARKSIDLYVKNGRTLDFETYRQSTSKHTFLNEAAEISAGAFVSLHLNGKLRGCIGTIESVYDHLGDEIIHNAILAATEDPRFEPVKAHEIPHLEIKVDVMGEMEPVDDSSSLDVQTYGIMIKSGNRRGLLLPALDGINTVEEQLSIVRQKACIGKDETCQMHRFRVNRYE
jgi:MEMO1 family protein